MGLLGSAKATLNGLLRPLNLRVESRSAERAEAERLAGLLKSGHFDRPAYPILGQFAKCDPAPVLEAVQKYETELARFELESGPDGFSYRNDYYASPDAEVLYAMVRTLRPRRIVEVGSGNSTLLFRHAITDGKLATRLISIDPFPRRDVAHSADEVVRERLESSGAGDLLSRLESNDILFIDSSHEIKVGNDVLHLLLNVLPTIRAGVVVHLHDIFLPYEYPKVWLIENRWIWGEQYLLQALLQDSIGFDVLWAGHYLQRTLPRFADNFKHWRGADAKSVWMRRRPVESLGGVP